MACPTPGRERVPVIDWTLHWQGTRTMAAPIPAVAETNDESSK